MFRNVRALAEFKSNLIWEQAKADLRAVRKPRKLLGLSPAISDAQIARTKTAIETKQKVVSNKAGILGERQALTTGDDQRAATGRGIS